MKYEWHEAEDFENLSPIRQVYGVCFGEDGKVMVIRQPGDDWNLVGGKPEAGETPEQTLRREVVEETNVTLGDCGMIGYQKYTDETGLVIYQLRYACRIARIDEVKLDPATNVVHERIFVAAESVSAYITYDRIFAIVKAAQRWLAMSK